ncbi:MAG: DUF5717 family protein [Lachnospiraceae bacterium]|nr:DUF5717 family protein [Lachnospiraceae bacterium]
MKENLSLFLELAKSDKEEAKRIFFGKTFKEYYLQNESELRAEYDMLLEGQDQNQILEEFLVCAGAKEPKVFENLGDEDHAKGKLKDEVVAPDVEKGVKEKVIEYYLAFRCGRLNLHDFCLKAYEQILDEESMEAELFRFELAMLDGREEEAENRMAQLMEEKPWEEDGFVESYFYYLKALYEKNPLINQSALTVIRANAEKDEKYQQYYTWIFLYLDEEIAFSLKKQIELIRNISEKESLLPILKYEVVSIWNRNPMLLNEFTPFVIDSMKFGLEQQIASREVCGQYARITRRMSEFQEEGFSLLEKIYEKYPEEEFLLSICRNLLHTGHCKTKYHKYIKEAVQKSIKEKGLFEAYIRTMDWNTFAIIDLAVVHYFSYSSSLSGDENAYLYTNLCMNEKEYGEVVRSYYPKIELFVLDSIRRGVISDLYIYLYRRYLPLLMENDSAIRAFPNLIFKKRIICDNPFMQSVVVKHLEKQQSDFYELQDGKAYCDIYSDQFMLVFYDKERNPYIQSVSWKVEPILDTEKFYALCKKRGIVHEKLLLREAGEFRKKTSFQKADIQIALRMQNSQVLSGELKEMILELLLDYYYKTKEYTSLEELLKQVRWEKIQEKNRISVIEYFISREFYEEAVKGMERYGFEEVKPELLKKAASYLINRLNGMKSSFAAHICEHLFLNRVYDDQIILYLQQHVPSEADYHIELWKQGMESGVYDAGYTEYIIVKAAENQKLNEELEEIFLEYVRRSENSEKLSHFILEEFGKWYFANGKRYSEAYADYLMKFLQECGWQENHYPLSWLHSISKKDELNEQEKELALRIVEDFVERDIYLAFFLRFDDKIKLPQKLYCMSFVTYQGRRGCQVTMHCQTGRKGIIWEMSMTEILSGIYIGYFRPFIDEHPDVYVTMEGDEKKYRKSVMIESGTMKGKGLKYHKINEMLSMIHSEKVYDLMNQFDETEYMIEKALEPWF